MSQDLSIISKLTTTKGDVWGIEGDINYRGFKVGDKVKWLKLFKDFTGTIVDLKNDKTATVKRDSDQEIVEVVYNDLTKIGNK